MAFCTRCGNRIPDSASFCPGCGAPVINTGGEASGPRFPDSTYEPDASLVQVFFRMKNRLNRKRYALRILALVTLWVGWMYIMEIISSFSDDLNYSALMPLSSLLLIASWGIFMTLGIRRCHDLGKSGIFQLLYFVPMVNFLFFFYLLLAEGQKGNNKYGGDPLDERFKKCF